MQKINKYIICSLILIFSCDDEISSFVNPTSSGKPYYIIDCKENEHPFIIRLQCGSSADCGSDDWIEGHIISETNDTNYVKQDEYVPKAREYGGGSVKYYGYYCANSDTINFALWQGSNTYIKYLHFYQIDLDNNGKYNLQHSIEEFDSKRMISLHKPDDDELFDEIYFSD